MTNHRLHVMSSHMSPPVLLNQLSALRREGNKIRTSAPVIQQWPWENGIVLERGSMTAKMRESMTTRDGAFEIMVLVSPLPHKMP